MKKLKISKGEKSCELTHKELKVSRKNWASEESQRYPRSRLCQIPYKVKIITHQNPPLGPFHPPHQSYDDPHDLKCRVRTYTMCSRNVTQGSSNDALVEVI